MQVRGVKGLMAAPSPDLQISKGFWENGIKITEIYMHGEMGETSYGIKFYSCLIIFFYINGPLAAGSGLALHTR